MARHKQKKNWVPSCLCGCGEHRVACIKCKRWVIHKRVTNTAWCANKNCSHRGREFSPKPHPSKG